MGAPVRAARRDVSPFSRSALGSSELSFVATHEMLFRMGIELVGIAIDCEWAEPMARFYEGLLGFEIRDLGPGGRWAQLFDPNGGVHLNIQGDARYQPPKWPEEPGQLTKMLHLEVQVDDLEAAVARAVDVGGSEAPWQPPDRNRDRIRVMLDPAGHPLCLFVRGE